MYMIFIDLCIGICFHKHTKSAQGRDCACRDSNCRPECSCANHTDYNQVNFTKPAQQNDKIHEISVAFVRSAFGPHGSFAVVTFQLADEYLQYPRLFSLSLCLQNNEEVVRPRAHL